METLTTSTTLRRTETLKVNWFEKQAAKFDQSRFAVMAILMTSQSCLGGIAAMYALQQNSYVSLSIISFATMAANSVFIAQSTAKWCLGIFYGAVIADIITIAINLLS